ncbi:MAG: FAD-dependent oxidoreductase, partial [Nonomuraea sp.]|nr:FAD-dependent oxidoreductase [Nonomuraea sp.]
MPLTKVVVIGGGYAGALAANHLRMRDDVEITLVNPRPEFVERVRLHQFVAGTGQATVDYATLLGEGVRLAVDTAAAIDAAGRTVRLGSGRTLGYDYLVYAVGSGTPVPEHAYGIADLESARRLRDRLAELPGRAPVTVVGGGLTGIETAAELAERGRRVTLVCGSGLAPTFSPGARKAMARWLARHGVAVLEGVKATDVGAEEVALSGGSSVASAATIWAGGFAVPGLAAGSGLRTDEAGRLLTDETLTSVDDERIVAAGDAAAPSGRALRMSCYAAGPLGAQAANTVLSRIAGNEPAV